MLLAVWKALAVVWIAALLGFPVAARAQEQDVATASFVSLGAGAFNVTDDQDPAADFRLEYRHGKGLWWFKPWAGIEVTSDGGLWGGAGVLLDFVLRDRFVVTASIGAGGYERGDGKDLGAEVEFRSQLEVGYRFDNATRLTVAFGHLSNAGIDGDNPGAETVTLYYHVPIDLLGALPR